MARALATMSSETGTAHVIVVGSFNIDHAWRCETLPKPGATLSGHYTSGPGGKGFNQAIAAARAGAATAFICALGDDAGGVQARALAHADNLELHAQSSDAPTGTAGIFVDARGNNSIVIGAGANAMLTPAFVGTELAATTASRVLLAQLESPIAAIAQALSLGRQAGATTVLNPAPANASTTPELLSLVDILTPNETEFAALLQRHAGIDIDPDSVAMLDDGKLHALARQLLANGTVVLTLGATGMFISHAAHALRGDSDAFYRVAAETVVVVDTTGAGDACNGALCAALARHRDGPFREHAAFANRYAALSTQRAGAAISMPRMDEFHAVFPDA